MTALLGSRCSGQDAFRREPVSKLSAKHYRDKLVQFFAVVVASAVTTDEDFQKIQDLQLGFTMNEQGTFMFTEELVRARGEIASSVAKAIGGDILHDKDVQDAVWKAAMDAVAVAPEQWPEIARACLTRIEEELGNTRYIIARNELVFLHNVDRLTIGPVQAITGETLVKDLASRPSNEAFALFVGEPSIAVSQVGTINAGISENCWLVETHTSRANERAAAEWLIDVAISLLRLTTLEHLGQLCPNRGEVEPNPIANPPRDFVISFDDKQFTLPGTRVAARYVVGEDALRRATSEDFLKTAKLVFSPQSGSVAERFQRCLGWQTKARQARDPSERFLFFFTALESLLAHSDVTAPIVDTVARHCASLLGSEPDARAKNAKLVRSLYQTRSKLVHTGSRAVTDREQRAVQEIAEYVSMSVLDKVQLNETYSNFQDQLREASYGNPFERSRESWLGALNANNAVEDREPK